METIQTIKLGTVCRDRATDLEGTLTHLIYNMECRAEYLFQPRGINPENGLPVKVIHMETARLIVPDDAFEETEIPVEILGSQVTDKASGFTGMAVALVMHINGCFHIAIQPKGVVEKTQTPIRQTDFDIRQCEGPMIPSLESAELEKSRREKPSPISVDGERFTPSDRGR